jgi:hypothetical protein
MFAKTDVLSTLLRLCRSGALPTLNLNSDPDLVAWAEETSAMLDALQNGTAPKKPQAPQAAVATTSEGAGDDSPSTDVAEKKQQPAREELQTPDHLLVSFTSLLSAHLHIRGYEDAVSVQDLAATGAPHGTALPRGAAQLLRHGNDVARVAMMAQRLAEEVTALQAHKLRSSEAHAQELASQAAAYRATISQLLEQQARLERQLDEERARGAARRM